MPKLKPDTQRARRSHILDAAERCFARTGFHATSMQEICAEAEVSPGALYTYFNSKEDLIAGIVERDRAHFAERFKDLQSSDDFMSALDQLGAQYLVDEPNYRTVMSIEIWLESTRNPRIRKIVRDCDEEIMAGFRTLFDTLKKEGRMTSSIDAKSLADMLAIIGDGVYLRRAIDPKFNPAEMMPTIIETLARIIEPQNDAAPDNKKHVRAKEPVEADA